MNATKAFELLDQTIAAWHRARGRPEKNQTPAVSPADLNSLPIIPYSEETAYQHACIWSELESAGKRIGYYDVIVAATALERKSQVATFNKKHFGLVKGLNVIEPK